jgi:hypothetical protein
MVASAAVALFPNLPTEAVCGVSAALAIFGTHFLEDLVKVKLGINSEAK